MEEFTVTFDSAGPLLMEVMGSSIMDKATKRPTTSIIVTSFIKGKDGQPGRAELCGKIRPRDVMLAVNDTTLDQVWPLPSAHSLQTTPFFLMT